MAESPCCGRIRETQTQILVWVIATYENLCVGRDRGNTHPDSHKTQRCSLMNYHQVHACETLKQKIRTLPALQRPPSHFFPVVNHPLSTLYGRLTLTFTVIISMLFFIILPSQCASLNSDLYFCLFLNFV